MIALFSLGQPFQIRLFAVLVVAVSLWMVVEDAQAVSAPRPADADPWRLCKQAIAAAEKAHRLPRHLLAAIALVESGRRRESGKGYTPWPWTITAEGKGRFLDSKEGAIEAVQELRSRRIRNIDVGCMQVNLHYHPRAFSDLDAGFDPATNATYAARHLRALFRETGSWGNAVSLYHNGKFRVNRQYRIRVMKVWNQLRGRH